MSSVGRILVVGGAGFIGSYVVDELIAHDRRVRVLDLLHPLAHGHEPDYLNDEAEYVWGDVRDPETVARALIGVDAVSHQAAMVGLGVDLEDIVDYVSHNALGTAVLLRAMHRARFQGPLVLAGSMVVYGEGRYECPAHGASTPGPRAIEDLAAGRFEPLCEACGAPLRPLAVGENGAVDPRSVYAATKLHQEHLAAAWGRESRTQVIRLRYHNVYGPRMPRDTPYAGVASIFRSALAAGEPARVFEDGEQLRDFVHVREVARANRLALEAPERVAGVFNIASGTPRSVGALASELARATGGPEPIVCGDFRLGDVRHVFASTDRAAAELGFRARIGFAEGITEFASARLREPASALA